MDGMLHNIQHFFQHLWCCYWPTIKSMLIPGVGILGSISLIKIKLMEYFK